MRVKKSLQKIKSHFDNIKNITIFGRIYVIPVTFIYQNWIYLCGFITHINELGTTKETATRIVL